jgi:hypothetical protein
MNKTSVKYDANFWPTNESTSSLKTFKNGWYQFYYPANYSITDWGQDSFLLAPSSGSDAWTNAIEGNMENPFQGMVNPSSSSYEDSIIATAMTKWSADGVDGSIGCDSISKKTLIINKQHAIGYEIQVVITDTVGGNKTTILPVYVFPVPFLEKSALFFSLRNNEVIKENITMLKTIVNTIKFNEDFLK